MIVDELAIDPADFTSRTGWSPKPEGLCKGDICVPTAGSMTDDDGNLDLRIVAEKLGMPIVSSDSNAVHAVGPASLGRSLDTATAPALVLDDVTTGNPFSLDSLHGRKVLLVAWASW